MDAGQLAGEADDVLGPGMGEFLTEGDQIDAALLLLDEARQRRTVTPLLEQWLEKPREAARPGIPDDLLGRAADACINQTRRAISSVRHLKSCATLHESQVEQAKQEVGLLLALPTLLLRPETPGGGNAGRQDASGDDSGPGSTPPGAKVQAASQSFCAATRRRIKLAEKMEMQELLQDALGEAEAATEARASAR